MDKIYINSNSSKFPKVIFTSNDYHLFLEATLIHNNADKFDSKLTELTSFPSMRYIYFSNDNFLMSFEAFASNNQVWEIKIISLRQIYIYNKNLEDNYLAKLDIGLFLNSEKFYLEGNPKELNKLYDSAYPNYDIKSHTAFELYQNGFIITLNNNINACYMLKSEDIQATEPIIGVTVDKDLNIAAFFCYNLPEFDWNKINEYLKYSQGLTILKKENKDLNLLRGSLIDNNQSELIEKLFELQNINLWELLYFGLKSFLIDIKLCMSFAKKYLIKYKENSSTILEMSNGLENNEAKILVLMEKLITNKEEIINNKDILYSKIWFYLSLAVEMKRLHITK